MITFRLTLTASIIIMISALAALLVFVQLRTLNVAAESTAVSTMDAASAQAAAGIRLQVLSLSRTVKLLSVAPSLADSSERNEADRGVSLMKTALVEHPLMDSFYVGYANGAWLQVQRLEGMSDEQRKRAEAPANAVFATTLVRPDEPTRRVFEDKEGNKVQQAGNFKSSYDARQRDWYLTAQEAGKLVILPPYISFSLGIPMLTLCAPLEGSVRGVVGADLKLDSYSASAAAQKIGKHGEFIVFDTYGNLIAHRDYGAMFARALSSPDTAHIPSIKDLQGSLAGEAIARWDRSDRQRGELRWTDGEDYFFRIERVGLGPTLNANVLFISARKDFAEEIQALNSKAKLAALIASAIFIPLCWIFGTRMSKTLQGITAQAARLPAMLAPPEKPIGSFIREINTLGRTVHQAQRAIFSFSRLAPKEIVRGVLDNSISSELGGARQEITVFFTDVWGFTSLSETADPDVLMRQTSRYFTALTEVILAEGGTIDKFIGDAVMAFWNAPKLQPDHCELACSAALLARKANEAINREFESEGLPLFRTRFGIHVGDAVVGNLGSSERMNYTALGSVVNLAARLEGLNKDYGTEILISEDVYVRVKDSFRCEFVDTVVAKGMVAKTRVYKLLAKMG
jgi:adenylate cyclase